MITLSQILAVIKSYGDDMPVPVFDMIRLIGIGPVFEAMTSNISGRIERAPTEQGYRIVVNSTHHHNRQRFTAAHELGHFMYHRGLLEAGVGDTLAYRADGSAWPNPKIGPTQEAEANRFASNLLMPNRLIEKLKAEGVENPREMAVRLGVSEAAMRIKLGLPGKTELFG